ncbi:hypothetical protein VB779_20660 [Haloarculaceae archaeon H-GB11]|nr:hypothetical protein [Haloarculaceae archaeon H-GB11]
MIRRGVDHEVKLRSRRQRVEDGSASGSVGPPVGARGSSPSG